MHFIDAQRRHRGASWRWSWFAATAAILAGVPVSILLSPLLLVIALVATHLIDLVAPVPAGVWRTLERIAHTLPNAWASTDHDPAATLSWILAIFVAPGATVMVVTWIWIRALFRHVGVGGVLRRLRARAPRGDVVEELQLTNIVGELAIAAGVPPPRVMVIESDAANAAAVGLTIEDATILVSRGLLEVDRDGRQAILAHVIASVANGDLHIASTILTVFHSWGLLALIIDLPFGPRSRRAIRQFAGASRRAFRDQAERARAASMLDRLLDGAAMTFDDLFEHAARAQTSRPLHWALLVDVPLYVTFGVAAIAAKAATSLFTLLVFGPPVGLLWRSRRRLADATAIQLTRNPDALARAVREMEQRNVVIDGGAAVSFLFPFWSRWTPDAPVRDDVMAHVVGMHLEIEQRLDSLERLGASRQNRAGAIADAAASIDTTRRNLAQLVGWTVVALLLVVACIAYAVLSTSLLLWAIWTVLRRLFGVPV